MLIVERQQRVLNILKLRKTVQLEELAQELDVSSSTIRRDLEHLESRGKVDRTRAGAIYRESVDEPNVDEAGRMNEQIEQKQAIASVAAQLVQPHMTVLMDGGSTVVYTAQQVIARPIQVVTNSLLIASHFVEDDKVELVMIGGDLYPRTGTTVGAIATGCLADLHADLLLFSLAGIYDQEAYNINLPMTQVEQVMMRQAAKNILLMDSTKFGRKSLVRVCGLNEVDQIITDEYIGLDWKQRLDTQIRVAEPYAQ